ncbi:MAG TPA: hemolysin family protein [Thermomicrobiales bacterium]|jgi:CBS domain containing-hemolysin-like protein|nr:hemolysin family protein [Thermomicrobiales bacterium]
MGDSVPGLIWLVVLLIANAFFVGAEFAVISARRSQIEPLADAGNKAAKTTIWAMEHATLMLATSQLGITVCSLIILNVSEPAVHYLLADLLEPTGLDAGTISIGSFIFALALVTFLHVVFGEMVPKNTAFSVPDRAALILAPPLVFVARLVKPVIWSLNSIANGILKLLGVEPKDEATSTYTFDQVAGIVEQSMREGVLQDESGTLSATFEFSARTVGDIEVPLANLVRLPATSTPRDIQRAVANHGYSRYILTNGDGEPMGYVHLKDVIDLANERGFDQPIPAKRIRSLAATGQTASVESGMAMLRQTGAHVARVYDSEGRITGVVFLEDILEELVGEVTDATSSGTKPASTIELRGPGSVASPSRLAPRA